ncbi:MAG: hypothetical protein P8M22_09740 [Phycisphaerales bacterium]|nr:hypothetical protein [Phycisphaerales bacterium]
MSQKLFFNLMAIISLLMLGGLSGPLVTRGGEQGGVGSVTVQTGHGVSVIWSTQTGTLQKAVITNSQGTSTLDIGTMPPSWFVQQDSGSLMPLQCKWRGYRINADQVTLLYELTVPDGPVLSVEEQPKSIVGPGGLLSLQRTFSVHHNSDDQAASPALVKRIRTGTNEGVTLPNRTNGRLQPLGLNDNLMADVTFANAGSTVITTTFNGHWVDQPDRPITAKESNP